MGGRRNRNRLRTRIRAQQRAAKRSTKARPGRFRPSIPLKTKIALAVESLFNVGVTVLASQVPSIRVALPLLILACLLQVIVLWRLRFFESWQNKWWQGVARIALSLAAVGFLVGLWFYARPAPELGGFIKLTAPHERGKYLRVAIYAEINNQGAPSVVNDMRFFADVNGKTYNGLVVLFTEKEGIEFHSEKGPDWVLYAKPLDEVGRTPIETGGQIDGAMVYGLEGITLAEFVKYKGQVRLTFTDIAGKSYTITKPESPPTVGPGQIPRIPGARIEVLPKQSPSV